MYRSLYLMAYGCLCLGVVLCLCCAFNMRTIAEGVCKVSIIPTPFRSETPLVDAYLFSHNLILIFNMINGNVLITIHDI